MFLREYEIRHSQEKYGALWTGKNNEVLFFIDYLYGWLTWVPDEVLDMIGILPIGEYL